MRLLRYFPSKNILFLFCFVFFGVAIPIYHLYSRSLYIDEATFLTIGDLIKSGASLYRDVADIKPPGIFYLAALVFSVAGKSFIAARILTCIIQACSAILILRIGTKIKNKNVGMLAAIFFLAGVYIPQFQGYYYITEPYAVFFSLISVFFFLKDGYRAKFFAGLALGMAILFKQTVFLVFGAFFLYYLLRLRFKENRTKDYFLNSSKKLTLIFTCSAIPFSITLLYFFLMDTATEMLHYTVFFISDYGLPPVPSMIILGFFSYLPICLLSMCMVLFVGIRFLRGKNVDRTHLFLVLWLLLCIIPAIKISPDHRILFAIPATALLAAVLLVDLYQYIKAKQNSNQVKYFIVAMLLVTTSVAFGSNIYYSNLGLPNEMSIDGQIQSAHEIERYVEGEEIYVIPFQPQVFFFSNLTSGITYLGGIFSEEMAGKVIKELQNNDVKYVVANRRAIDRIETGERLFNCSNARVQIYDHILENYEVLTITDYYVIYKSID